MAYRPYYLAYKDDPYFHQDYIESYLKAGDEIFDFYEEDGQDFFCFRSIKRPITSIGDHVVQGQWYDLESVYGYGGYITNSQSQDFVKRALDRLRERCNEERIIAHFMRFHPLSSFVDCFKDQLDMVTANRKVIFVDTDGLSQNEVKKNYSSSLKRNINKARRLGLMVREMETTSENQSLFMKLYYSTMDRKGADELYFFSQEYFDKLFKINPLKLFGTYHESTLISMILTLDSGQGEVYYHLGATHHDYYSYNPNPFVLNHIAEEVAANGGKFLFLGGGNSNDMDDPLFKFKKKFASDYKDFYIGGSVFNQRKYDEFRTLAGNVKGTIPPMFLAYRFV